MNTPPSKPPSRFPASVEKRKPTNSKPNIYWAGVNDSEFAAVLGSIVTQWTHLEELMIDILAILLGTEGEESARQVFRSVNSTQARIKIMRSLLEESSLNKSRERAFDEIINEFESLTKERNKYVHGLWYTDVKGRVTRSDPSDGNYAHAMFSIPVCIKHAQQIQERIRLLGQKIFRQLKMQWVRRDASPLK